MSSSYNDEMDTDDMEMDVGESAASTNVVPPPAPPVPAVSNDPAAQKRRAIQEILKDKTLTDLERRLRIQSLMDGRPAQQQQQEQQNGQQVMSDSGMAGISSGGSSNSRPHTGSETANCQHYERNCFIVSPCCNQVFGCRICHDEASSSSTSPTPNDPRLGGQEVKPCERAMDRFAIQEVVCKQCHTRQNAKTNNCAHCGIQFGEYHCAHCNLWMPRNKQPFHCNKCGFCRVGGEANFKHCDSCCMCISNTVFGVHNCMRDKYKNDCPVCREDMFSSRQAPQDLPCGHAIHSHCFRKLASFDYRCPICKKTVVCKNSMEMAWAARARDIELQPMPPDLRRVVNIMCNDCETKSLNREWHFLGVQCPSCRSFNTIVEQVVSGGDETLPNPPTGAGAS